MNINLVCPIIVLDNEINPDIRKNDVKTLKLLVDKQDNQLLSVKLTEPVDIKNVLKENITKIINTNTFHLEQVYTLGEDKYYLDNSLDIIYLAITNKENIVNLDEKYHLIDFSIKDNIITFDNDKYHFKTEERTNNNNIEYYHVIDIDNPRLEKELLEIIIAYKHLRSKLDSSDIIFKFMANTFTLEDVRIVYEMIKEVTVDKSNFRKRVVKYCKEVSTDYSKKGYRPSKTYKFIALKGDIWL